MTKNHGRDAAGGFGVQVLGGVKVVRWAGAVAQQIQNWFSDGEFKDSFLRGCK